MEVIRAWTVHYIEAVELCNIVYAPNRNPVVPRVGDTVKLTNSRYKVIHVTYDVLEFRVFVHLRTE